MKPISIPMFANKPFSISLLIGAILLFAGAAVAVDNLGGHFRDPEEFNQIIVMRCTGCHTRERIDAAIERQESLEKLMQQMVGRGATITEREKEVLGTFWGTPLKERKEPSPGRP